MMILEEFCPDLDALKEGRRRCNSYIGKIAVGSCFYAHIAEHGKPIGCGNDDYDQCKVTKWKNITTLSAGSAHILGLDKNGKAFATGFDPNGRCKMGGWKDLQSISA